MGGSGYQIHGLPGGYAPAISEKGVDIYGGPRGSLAGTLPSWIAWWTTGFRYQPGHIVYMPGVYERDYNVAGQVINQGSFSPGQAYDDGRGNLSYKRDELAWDQDIQVQSLQEGGDLTGGSMSRGAGSIKSEGAKQYFEYGSHTLWVKLFGGQDNAATNDSSLTKDADFFDVNKRRKNGWYCFYELMRETDPIVGGNLEIAFPGNYDIQSNQWDSNKKRYTVKVNNQETLKVVYGSWGEDLFRQIPCEPNSATEIAVFHDETILNMCDTFALLASTLAASKHLVNFVVCKSVLRSPGSLGEDESASPVEVAILPTDKITIGGNVLRSPQKVAIRDTVDNSFDKDSSFFENDSGSDEEITMLSAGYPGIMNPEALFHAARNADDFDAKISDIAKGNVVGSDVIVGEQILADSEQLYLDKIKFGKMPAYDPRFGEAATSLNSFISSVYNFSLPMSTSASIDFWEANILYKVGKVVRLSPNATEYNAAEAEKNFKDVVWVCKKEHTSGVFAGEKCPPLGSGGSRSVPEVFENTYWRSYGVLANQPNSSLLQLNDLYRDSEIFVPTINVTKSASENLNLGEADFSRSLLGSSRRIRMSEMSGGCRLYASLTISPAKKFDVKYYRKRNSWGRRRTVSFRFPPQRSDAAQADLWLYANNFRKDHAGSINFAVTFVEHTGFVWAQAKRRRGSFFGVLLGVAFAVVGILNPALFLTAGMQCAAWGFGGGLALGALGGAVGLGIGTALGASAEAVYANLGKGVGRKKAFTRQSFSKIVSKVAADEPSLDYVLQRGQSPDNGVVIGKNSSDVAQDMYDSSSDTKNENDIIRFNFGNLYPYLYESKHNNTIHVTGEYQFMIQDLNSAQTIKVDFKYEEISRRRSRNFNDSFGQTFSGYPRGTPESPHASASSTLYNAYVSAANDIISGSTSSGQNLKLIATRNYFNYLLIGQENVRDANDPLKALTMWSVDLSNAQFNALIGMMQTGFRDLVFSGDGSFADQDGLSDYHEFYTENPPIAAAENEAAPGYQLEIENNSIKAVIKDPGLETERRVGVLTSVSQTQSLDREEAEVLAKGLVPGEFKLGKELSESTPQYINFLNTPSITDSIKWGDIQSGIKINGGSVIEHDSKFYFVNSTFIKGSQNLTDVATLVPGSSSSIYTADSFSPSLTLTKQWQKMIESEFYLERAIDRSPAYSVVGRKLDFSFIVKESADSSLINLFLFGFSDFVPRFSMSNFRTYFVDSVATISIQRPIKDISGQLLGEGTASWSQADTKDTQDHVFRLKEDIPDKENPNIGTIPGFKDETSWEYIGMPPDLSNNAFDWSLPVLNEISEFSAGDDLLTGSRTRSIGFLTSNSERFRLVSSDTIEDVLARSDANSINFPWIKRDSQESGGTYISKTDRNGDLVHLLCPYNSTNQDQWGPSNVSSVWKSVMNSIIGASNVSHLLDAYLTNELDTARSFSDGAVDLTHIQFVISPVSDIISSLEVWDASKNYNNGDVVAVHHTNYHYVDKSTGNINSRSSQFGKLWMFAKARKNIVANTNIPLFDDNGDPGAALGKSTSELATMVLPIETKYWECATAREGTGKEAVTSAIGSKKLSKSYYGTDLDVKSYGISMGSPDTYQQKDRATKTTVAYVPQQRMIYNNNVNTDFQNVNNLIFTTTISEDAKIVGRLPAESILYTNQGGTWPGTVGDKASTYLSRVDWANLYPENQLISLFLQRTVNAGAKWTTWLDAYGELAYGEQNKTKAYETVTFSQGDEFNQFQTIPNVTLGVSKDDGTTFSSYEAFRNFDPNYPVFHKGYTVPIGIKASVTNTAGLIVKPSSTDGSNLYGYASCLAGPGESIVGGQYGKITYVHEGSGSENVKIMDSSGSVINNVEISERFRSLVAGDKSGVIGYGPECLTTEFNIHSISGIDMANFTSALSVKLPEKCATREIADLCTQKCVLVLGIRDGNDGTTLNRTRFKNFYTGSGINFEFDNWFARRDSSGNYKDSFGESWPDSMRTHGEDDEIIKVVSKLNTVSEAVTGLIDVCGAGEADSHKDKTIKLSDTETHYHGFEQEFLPYDDIGLAYITEILKGAGQFIGSQVGAGFNASGTYIGGSGLTQTTMATAEFMAISQPAFEDGLMHGKPPGSDKIYFYSNSNYDFKLDVSIPSLLYKKYVNNDDPSDVVNKNYYDTLFDSNSPGGGDAKNDFYEEYVFLPEFKIYLNNNLQNTYNQSSSEFSEINGYIGRFTLNKAKLGNPSNNSIIKFTIDDGITCPHGANFKELSLTAKVVQPPSFSAMENNINGKLYYYTNDDHLYSFGVAFPNSSTFGGRVVINDGVSGDQFFESSSGAPNVDFTGPGAGSTQVTITVDDGIPFGFGKARTGAAGHNLIYPSNFDPVQIFPVAKIPVGDIFLTLSTTGDGFIANKTIGTPPDIEVVDIMKQYIYNKYDHEYSGLIANIPAFAVDDVTDRTHFVSSSSITGEAAGSSTQLALYFNPFFFFSAGQGLVTLKEDMFPEEEEGIQNFTIQDGTFLSSPKSSAVVQIPYIRINRPHATITGIDFSETFKLWNDSPLVASGEFEIEGLISCSEFANIKITTDRGEYNLSDEDGLENPPDGGFTNFRWNFTDYNLDSSINGEADLIDGLYVTILDRNRGTNEGTDTWETYNYTTSETIDLFLDSNEYKSNYASGDIVTTDPLKRIRFSKSISGIPLTVRIQDNVLKDNGIIETKDIELPGQMSVANIPIYSKLKSLFEYEDQSDSLIKNRMGGQFNIVDKDWNPGFASLEDFQVRRYSAANSALLYSSYTVLSSLRINYHHSANVSRTKNIFETGNRTSYDAHDARIAYDSARHGNNEPNVWAENSGTEDWSQYCTTAMSNGAIDLCPNAMGDLIWSDDAKWLRHEDVDPSSPTSPDERAYDDFVIWHPKDHKGEDNWEIVGRSDKDDNDESSMRLPDWVGDDDGLVSSDQDWFSTTRLMGWRVTCPHLSFIGNLANCAQDTEKRYVHLHKNGSAVWGGLSLSDIWKTDSSGDTSENWFGYDRKSYIGLQTGQASRITKFVYGLSPGVTYRLYLSAAYRPDYGPSGARVYICEPDQSQSESGDLNNELIAYGEFTCNASRSIDYNAKNHFGGRGVQTNFVNNKPFSGNTAEGSTTITNDSEANLHSKVGEDGFRLYYVEFTPTLGSGVVEIRIENAFVDGLYNGVGRGDLSSYDYTWQAPTQGHMFDVSEGWFSSSRKNWTEYSGIWASNGIQGSSGDQTVFIGDVFIRSVRPLYVESLEFNASCDQGGYEIIVKNGDTENSAIPKTYLRSPDAHRDIFKKMADSGYSGPILDMFGEDYDSFGWFENGTDYEVDIVRPHPYLLNWDPFAVDAQNFPAVGSSQGYIAKKFIPDVFGDSEHGVYDLDAVVDEESVEALYEIMLGRASDEAGRNAKISSQMTVDEVITEMLDSAEYASNKASLNLPDDPRPEMSKDRPFHPNLMPGFYLGHTCFFSDGIWRISKDHRKYSNSDYTKRRPGYDNWNWADDYDAYVPKSTSDNWENISDLNAAQIFSDAAAGTGAYHNSSLNSVRVYDSSKFTESDKEMMWSAHFLDSFFRRPFVQEHLKEETIDYIGDLGRINNFPYAMLIGENPQARDEGDSSEQPEFRFGDVFELAASDINKWTNADGWLQATMSTPTDVERQWHIPLGFFFSPVYSGALSKLGGIYSSNSDAEFVIYKGGWGQTVGPNYPIVHASFYDSATSLWTARYDREEFLMDPIGASLSSSGEALNANQTKRMIGNSKHSVSYAFGIGTAIEFSSRGESRLSRIELPINIGQNGSGIVSRIGDNYYGGANPVPHYGLAHEVNNAGYFDDYDSYNSITDKYKYTSSSLSLAFSGRQRRNLI